MCDWRVLRPDTIARFWLVFAFSICGMLTQISGARGAEEEPRGQSERCEQNSDVQRQFAEALEKGIEESMREAERKSRLQHDRRMKGVAGMESVSREQFDAAWKVDLDVDRQPARQVLDRLLSEMGLRLPDDSDFDDALDQPVSVHLRGASRLQAIEEVCGQISLHPDYGRQRRVNGGLFGGMMRAMQSPAGGSESPPVAKQAEPAVPAIMLREGRRPRPMAFAGPFGIRISRLDEFPPYASGSLQVRVYAGGVPDSVSTYWKIDNWAGLRIEEVESLAGRDLAANCIQTHTLGGPGSLPCRISDQELKDLVRDVRSVRVKGRITARTPARVETVRFDNITPGAVRQGKELRVKVTKIDPPPSAETLQREPIPMSSSLFFSVESKSDIQLKFVPLDVTGKAINVDIFSYGGGMRLIHPDRRVEEEPEWRSGCLVLSAVPKSLIVKAILAVDEIEYPVELVENLNSFDKQPHQTTELHFSGDAPVTTKVLKISGEPPFRDVHLRVTNASNKDIREVHCKLNYVDPSGKIVKRHPTRLSPPPFTEWESAPLLVASDKAAEVEATAFFAPDNLASATVTLTQVIFADNTAWASPED